MPQEGKQPDPISPEIQDVMRNLVASIRAVKLYPSNNPVYLQSIHKAYEPIARYLEKEPHFAVGVQKGYFLFDDQPVSKETQINRTIAQDLFAKGVREIVFHAGLTEKEFIDLLTALALTADEIGLQSGVVSILWEMGVGHIKVTEAALEDVITASAERSSSLKDEGPPAKLDASLAKKELHFKGRTLLLGDLVDDPKSFGSKMVELAQQTLGENETLEDRLHTLYQEAGRMINDEDEEDRETLFRGLARSIMEMDPQYRNKFVSDKLYAHVDSENLDEELSGGDPAIPSHLHEIITGRFSKEWNIKQLVGLLKESAKKQFPPKAPPVLPTALDSVPIVKETFDIARELAEYTPDEMEYLRSMSEAGTETDITEAAVRTLIFMLPLVKTPAQSAPTERDIEFFSNVVHQLEDLLSSLLKKKDYVLARIIVRAFSVPVEEAFRPRLEEAIEKASGRKVISEIVSAMRGYPKASPEYRAAYAYLSTFARESTAALLDALADEKDREMRIHLIEVIKDLGRSQLATIGQSITDNRWYVVRNVVSILSESKSEDILPYLEKVAAHKQVQIRQEVINALLSLGGRKAAAFVGRFLHDRDDDVQLLAVHSLGSIQGAGAEPARVLETFLEGRHVRKKDNELTVEAIRSLAKVGDRGSIDFLGRYRKRKWWKSRKLQEELRVAAVGSIDGIQRRLGDGGRKT